MENPEIYLSPTKFIDSNSPQIIKFAKETVGHETTNIGKAVKLYYAVRDGFRYDPYKIEMRHEAFKASVTLARKYGFCISKAILLAALARSQNIPSRLGFANVRNHLMSERLKRLMKSDIFRYHGYAELFLEDKWVKATPAFNLSLCKRFGVAPLEFDGKNDSMFQAFDPKGNRHMEYLHDYGQFPDLPYDDMVETFKKYYPLLLSKSY